MIVLWSSVWRQRSGIAFAASALAALSGEARADETTPLRVVRANRAESCPDGATFAARVNAHMRREAVAAEVARAADAGGHGYTVRFERRAKGFRAALRENANAGHARTITDLGSDCTGLADAVAVTLAIVLDDGMPLEAQVKTAVEATADAKVTIAEKRATVAEAKVAIAETKASAAATLAAEATTKALAAEAKAAAFIANAQVVAAEKQRSLDKLQLAMDRTPPPVAVIPQETLALDVGGAASFGLVGALAPALVADATARVATHVGLGVGFILPESQTFAAGPGEVAVSLALGIVRGCYVAPLVVGSHTWELSACPELAVGALRGEGRGYATTGRETRPWVLVGASVEGSGSVVGPLGWFARTQLLVPTRDERFGVQGIDGAVFEAGPATGLVSAGVRAGF